MPKTWCRKWSGFIWIIGVGLLLTPAGRAQPGASAGEPLILHARVRLPVPDSGGAGKVSSSGFLIRDDALRVDPAKTAIIICDMWDQHWCRGADASRRRAGPRHEPRGRRCAGQGGVHHPRPQQLHGSLQGPSRPPARRSPPRRPRICPPTSRGGAARSPPRRRGSTPSTSRTGAATTARRARRARPGGSRSRPSRSATRTPSATRASRSGTCWRAGASTTCCSWACTRICASSAGRSACGSSPCHGKHAFLVRDLTDTMYNSRSWPYVSHFQGTERIIEHIEKFVAPTITSTDLTGGRRSGSSPTTGPARSS